MKLIQETAAYRVMDAQQEIIEITAAECDHMNPDRRIFCMAIPNSRGQYHFAQVSPGNLWDYYASSGYPVNEEVLADAKARGHELFWLNLCGVSLTAWKRPQEEWILIQPGQLLTMAGKTLKADIKRGYPTLTEV